MKRGCGASGKSEGVVCEHCNGTGQLLVQSPHNADLLVSCILLHPDLPSPWLSLFLTKHLTAAQRLAIFRACKGLAKLVVRYSSRLKLQPSSSLDSNSNRRSFVLGLAAGCSNIHLSVYRVAVILDTPAIWENITQLTLCDVGLSRHNISRLLLSRLAKLHTIELRVDQEFEVMHEGSLDEEAVGRLNSITQAGALPALCTLSGSYSSIRKLAPVLGSRITKLVLESTDVLEGFAASFPEVQHLEIRALPNEVQQIAQIQQQLFSHPKLKHVKVPSRILKHNSSSSGSGVPAPAWDSLVITGGMRLGWLSRIPLQGVQQLQVQDEWFATYNEDSLEFLSVLSSLKGDSTVVLRPQQWHKCCILQSSADDKLPVLSLPFIPSLLNCMFRQCPGLEGGLIFSNAKVDVQTHLPLLKQVPAAVHTLLFSSWDLCEGCTWVDVFASIPSHVKHVLIQNCNFTEACWRAVLNQPAPAGLHTVTLASNGKALSWVPHIGDELLSMQALVSTRWPHVLIEVDNRGGLSHWDNGFDMYYDEAEYQAEFEAALGDDMAIL